MDDNSNLKNEQLNNPLHGVKLCNFLSVKLSSHGYYLLFHRD